MDITPTNPSPSIGATRPAVISGPAIGVLEHLTDDDRALIQAATGFIVKDGAVQNPVAGRSVDPLVMMIAADRMPAGNGLTAGALADGRPITSDYLSELFTRQNTSTDAGVTRLDPTYLTLALDYISHRDRRDGDPGKGNQIDKRL
jgi:hypothetical protein